MSPQKYQSSLYSLIQSELAYPYSTRAFPPSLSKQLCVKGKVRPSPKKAAYTDCFHVVFSMQCMQDGAFKILTIWNASTPVDRNLEEKAGLSNGAWCRTTLAHLVASSLTSTVNLELTHVCTVLRVNHSPPPASLYKAFTGIRHDQNQTIRAPWGPSWELPSRVFVEAFHPQHSESHAASQHCLH